MEFTHDVQVSKELLEDEGYQSIKSQERSVLIESLFFVNPKTMLLKKEYIQDIAVGTNLTRGQVHNSLKRLDEQGFYKCISFNGIMSEWEFTKTDLFRFE